MIDKNDKLVDLFTLKGTKKAYVPDNFYEGDGKENKKIRQGQLMTYVIILIEICLLIYIDERFYLGVVINSRLFNSLYIVFLGWILISSILGNRISRPRRKWLSILVVLGLPIIFLIHLPKITPGQGEILARNYMEENYSKLSYYIKENVSKSYITTDNDRRDESYQVSVIVADEKLTLVIAPDTASVIVLRDKEVYQPPITKVLKLAYRESSVTALDPKYTYENQMTPMIFSGLFKLDRLNRVEADLVKSYRVSEDGLTWTFLIDDQARWSNGQSISAEDFVYSWKRLKPDQYGSNPGSWAMSDTFIVNSDYQDKHVLDDEAWLTYLETIDSQALGIKALDHKTLEVKLYRPNYELPYMLARQSFVVIHKNNKSLFKTQPYEFGETIPDLLDTYRSIIASGPFKFKSVDDDKKVTLNLNTYYGHREVVRFERVEFRAYEDYYQEGVAYLRGDLHVLKQHGESPDFWEKDYIKMLSSASDVARSKAVKKENIIKELYKKSSHRIMKPTYYGIERYGRGKDISNRYVWLAIYHTLSQVSFPQEILEISRGLENKSFIPKGFMFDESGIDIHSKVIGLKTIDKETIEKLWYKGLDELGKSEVKLVFFTDKSDLSLVQYKFFKSVLEKNLPGLTLEHNPYIFSSSRQPDQSANYIRMVGYGHDKHAKMSDFTQDYFTKSLEESMKEYVLERDYKINVEDLPMLEVLSFEEASIVPMYQTYDTYYLTYEGQMFMESGVYNYRIDAQP